VASKTKASFDKSPADLVKLFDAHAPTGAGIVRKPMFGWPCCFVNGNLFVGLHKETMLFRLSDSGLAAFLTLKGAKEFEPMPGRRMKGYGVLASPLTHDPKLLDDWIARSLEFARRLPAKDSKPASKEKPVRKSKA